MHSSTRTTSLSLVLLALILATSLVACSSPQQSSKSQVDDGSAETWQRTEFYFGMKKKDGGSVTPAEFNRFVDDVITPRFRDGLTTVAAAGQWLNADNMVIKEESRVVILFHTVSAEAARKIGEIAEHYKKRFDQESVLVATAGTSLQFL